MRIFSFIVLNIFVNFSGFYAAESQNTGELYKKLDMIRKATISKYHCKLSDNEAYEIFEFQLKKEGITPETLKHELEKLKRIKEGLKLVVFEKKSPNQIYEKLNLNADGISIDNWNYYVKTYDTLTKIRDLEKDIEKFIASDWSSLVKKGMREFSDIIEIWILGEYILNLSSSKRTAKGKISNKEILSLWWEQELKNYKLSDIEYKTLNSLLSKSFNFSKTETQLWRKFLKKKLPRIYSVPNSTEK